MLCLFRSFLGVRGKNLRGLEGVRYPSKPLIFNSSKLGEFEGGVVPLILKKFMPLCQFISISLKLANVGHNCQFI